MAIRPLIGLLALLVLATGCGDAGGDAAETAPESPPAEREPPPRDRDGEPAVGDGHGGIELERIAELAQPVYLAQPAGGDDALYVVEQCGRIVRVGPGGDTGTFLDLGDEVSCGGERGLLSLAFHPGYGRNGRLYVDYTDAAGDTRVVEYRRSKGDETAADPGSARELLHVPQPFQNHNGGLALFGPDGLLHIGLGDGGSAGDPNRAGLDLDTLLGKILRIDPLPSGGDPYRIPHRNPFADGGGRPEIVAYGLRNPWRFSFDRETGDLWIADVGQDSLEEINGPIVDLDRGPSFGWSAFEGTERFNEDQQAPDQVAPALEYSLDGPECAVTGGYVVRDPRLESLYGRYLYGDFCTGELRSFVPDEAGARDDRALGPELPSLSSFAEDANGRIYALSLEGGVHRLRSE